MENKLKNTFKAELLQLGLCDDGCTWVGDKDFKAAYTECKEPEWLMRFFKTMTGHKGWPTRAEITAINIRIASKIVTSHGGAYVTLIIEEMTGVNLVDVVGVYNMYSSNLVRYDTFLKARKSAKLAFNMLSEPRHETFVACAYYACYPTEHTAAAAASSHPHFKAIICDMIKSTFPVCSLNF